MKFVLNISGDAGYNEVDTFYLQIGAPEIQQTHNTIIGNLQPNSTVGLEIELSNYGASAASGITATLSSSSAYIVPGSITGSPQSYQDIDPNSSTTASFGFTITSSYTSGHEDDLYFILTIHDSHGKEWTTSFNLKKPSTPSSTSLSFTGHETSIDVRWAPNSDSDLKGYNVYRNSSLSGNYQKVNNRLIEGTSYFNDMGLEKETIYYYKVSAVDVDANESGLTSAMETWTTIANLSGWPIHGQDFGFISSSPTLADIDNDGIMEIFTADQSGKIYAFDQQGTTVSELFDIDNNPTTWSGFANISGGNFWGTPAVSDLDGDGIYELIIAGRYGNNTLYCWHIHDGNGDGKPDLFWSVNLGDASVGSPAIGDIDHDGYKEVVVMTHNGQVHIRKYNGTVFSDPWKTIGGVVEAYCTPALVDLDNDRDLEIIIGGSDGKMYVCHHDGSNYSTNWPFNTGKNDLSSSPAVSDIDRDGNYEIIFIAGNNTAWNLTANCSLYVKDEFGNDKPGWSGGRSIGNIGHIILTSPAVGNLDSDDQLEIVVGTQTQVFAWNHDGSNLTGWPIAGFSGMSSSSAIADIDELAGPEVIIGSGDHNLYAWHADGSKVKGWPLITGDWIAASPAIGDIDGDGDYEVVAGSMDKSIYVWNTKGTTNKDWPMFHYDAENTGFDLQNTLYYYALQNKSLTYSATSHNNNHILERGYFGKLHFVFSSGGEIFY